MISSSWRIYRSVRMVGDAAAIAAAYVLADVLRCALWAGKPWPERIAGIGNSAPVHLWMAALLAVIWPAILWQRGWYEPVARGAGRQTRAALAATAILVPAMAALALVFQRELYPRSQLGFMAILAPATALAVRRISGWIGDRLGRRAARHVLIVGTGREALRVRRLLRRTLGRPTVMGHLRLSDEPGRGAGQTGAVLGSVGQLGEFLDRHVVDEVIFAVPLEETAAILPYVALCEEVGVTAALSTEARTCRSRPTLIDMHGLPMLQYAGARHAPEMLLLKRMLDAAAAGLCLLLTWPLLLGCAVLIRLANGAPVLFRQQRSGLNGRPFEMLKFRTMAVDAESRRADVGHLNEADGPAFKSTRDPRVTRVGAWLRRYSLDELPQLFNVLRGDMSMVGPRPPLPEEVAQYDRWQRRRLSMRPGLTCLWQIKGRHRIGFEEWMKLDLFYIDHWSLKLDLLILGKTVVAVVSGSGA